MSTAEWRQLSCVTRRPKSKAGPVHLRSSTPSRTWQLVFYGMDRCQVALAHVSDLYITPADEHQLLHRDLGLVLIFPAKDSKKQHDILPNVEQSIHLLTLPGQGSLANSRGAPIVNDAQTTLQSVICRRIDPLFFSAFPSDRSSIQRRR